MLSSNPLKRNPQTLGYSAVKRKPAAIMQIARKAGIHEDEIKLFGHYKAKVSLKVLDRLRERSNGKLICISGITPTKTGEGKTCTSIGLTEGLELHKKKVILCLREPSLAPIFGNKGGATGSGFAQVLPADDINLHFTGDIHAIEIATNLLAAVIDNHRHHGNKLGIDASKIFWRRSLDISDRQLREVIVGASKASEKEQTRSAFDITPASEIMAILSLSRSIDDLKKRLSNILVAMSVDGRPVTAGELKAVGAMAVLLREAIEPNLVQTLEGQPAFVHTGPFANVSHGNNSILATQMALKLADYVVTESGFGTDLGMEKMFDIVSRIGGFEPSTVVLVVTVKALKSHSGDGDYQKGYENLEHHVANIRQFGLEPVIAVNRFPQDSDEEIERILDYLKYKKIEGAVANGVAQGGNGMLKLADAVLKVLAKRDSKFKPLYAPDLDIEEKCRLIAQKVYGADDIVLSDEAKKDLETVRKLGYHKLPVNIAKTPFSLSDNDTLKGAPKGWKLNIRSFRIFGGAGYVVALAGKLMLMPGLPEHPMLEQMDIDNDGNVTGV